MRNAELAAISVTRGLDPALANQVAAPLTAGVGALFGAQP